MREILGVNTVNGLAFDAILQLATSLAVVVYFRKDIKEMILNTVRLISGKFIEAKDKILILAVILGTIPAVIFGLLLESSMETVFRNINLVAITLILGSVLFWFADKTYQKTISQKKELTLKRGIIIGFFQCLALIPGMSRSGSTISGGLIAGLEKEHAVKFSFLLSIPILLGSGLKKIFDVRMELLSNDFGFSIILASLTAFITGLIAINFLIKYLKYHNFNLFIWYRVALAVIILLFYNI